MAQRVKLQQEREGQKRFIQIFLIEAQHVWPARSQGKKKKNR